MDALWFLLKGLVIGVSIAAPVGPIGLLCIRRTLVDGPAHGLVSGLGAASADAVYGMVAGFGLAAVSDLLVGHQTLLRVAGGLFLLGLGAVTFRARPAERETGAEARGLFGAYASTFALTLTNPMTILSFAAVFGGLGLAAGGSGYDTAGALVLGVFLGSGLWWLTLSAGVGLLRRRVAPEAMVWINRGSGLVLMGFGAVTLAGLV